MLLKSPRRGLLSQRGGTGPRRCTEKTGISLRAAKWALWQPSTRAGGAPRENTRTEIQEGRNRHLLVFHVLVLSRVGRKGGQRVDGCPCPRDVGIFFVFSCQLRRVVWRIAVLQPQRHHAEEILNPLLTSYSSNLLLRLAFYIHAAVSRRQ